MGNTIINYITIKHLKSHSMEGKTIDKILELGDNVVLMKMDDGTYVSAKILDPEIPADAVSEFLGEEAPAKAPKGKDEKAPKAKEKEKEETQDDELTWDGLKEMKRKALVKLIEEKDLLADPDEFEDDDDGLRKEIAEELDIEIPKKGKKEEPKEDDYTWEDLQEMDFDELKELCEENKLDTDPDDFDEDDEDKLRKAIAKECEIEIPAKKGKK